jgi:hypothetical protein
MSKTICIARNVTGGSIPFKRKALIRRAARPAQVFVISGVKLKTKELRDLGVADGQQTI